MPFALFNYSFLSHMYIVLALSSAVTKLLKKTFIFMTFKDRQLNSMTFQAWKMKFLNSMTFQVFHDLYEPRVRASDRSQKKKSNFAGLLGTNSRKNRLISREFRWRFRGKLHQKAISKKRPILWLFSTQISLEIDRFCADQTSIFNVFLTEVIICSFNNNMLQK